MTTNKDALEVLQVFIQSREHLANHPLSGSGRVTYNCALDCLLRNIETIYTALQTQAEWLPFDDWHEDHSDCLFAFWDYEFKEYSLHFTNPLNTDFIDYLDDDVECVLFLKVKDLPPPPIARAEGKE